MPDILLTHGYFLEEDEKEQQIMRPYPPLGLLYISAYLKRAGFGVEVFDSTLRSRRELSARLAAGSGVLGLYANLITRGSVCRIAREAREHGWTVVLGGPEPANYPHEYLDHGGDVVVVGEGEETLAELLPMLSSRGPHRLEGVRGIWYRDESRRIVQNEDRSQIADLDSLPWPDRGAIDIPAYVDVWRTHHGAGSLNLITARGCPYRCRWCSHAVFGFTHRRRSHLDCADELEHILVTYRPDQVWYSDDVFTINHGWLFRYAAELKRRDLRVPFETISRADRMMSEDVVNTLAEMGCRRIWIGSESGSQRVLDAMERGVTTEQVVHATRLAKRHGIEVGMFLMWGYEGEEPVDIEATVEHVKKASPDVFFTTVAYPIKNTGYFDQVSDRVRLEKPWVESTDRDYAISGRRGREYYAIADGWIRSAAAAVDTHGVASAEHAANAAKARASLLGKSGGPA